VLSIGVKELLESGVHFGHQTKRWNPKMKPFIFDARNGIHIIDLSKTLTQLEAALPALISVTEKINEPRYPSFKGIMAAKKKPVSTLTVADLGVDAGDVGLANAWSSVLEAAPKPPRSGGQKTEDEGDGGVKIAEYLVSQKLI